MNKADIFIADRYRITPSAHKTGGMAEIVQAVDTYSGKFIAIKKPTNDTLSKESLFREAMTLRELSPHPNIVSYIGEEVIDGTVALLIEWLDHSLHDKLDRYKFMPWNMLMSEIGKGILSGLNHAHQHKFQHRDVHTGNIMFSDSGAPKLIDFGIAKNPQSVGVGLTFHRHGNAPYTPQNQNDLSTGFSRDCYSFAVVMLSCIQGRTLTGYEDVDRTLDDIDPLAYPAQILRDCIKNYPQNCPRNAGSLKARLTRWQELNCPDAEVLRLAIRTADRSPAVLPNETVTWPEVLEDLMSTASVDIEEGPPIRIHFGGQMYRATFSLEDPREGLLRLEGKIALNKASWSAAFLQLPVSLIFAGESQAKSTPWRAFAQAFQDAIEDERSRKEQETRDLPFTSWENYLAAEQQLLAKRPSVIFYNNLTRINDRDFSFELDSRSLRTTLSEDVSLLSKTNKRNLIRILEIEENRVRASAKFPIDLAVDGSFAVEYHAVRQALVRKKRALFTVKDGLSVSPLLRNILTAPSEALGPELSGRDFKTNDEHQNRAIDAALGCQSWVMIEGPPGTGKSTVIADIIRQYRHDNRLSKPRILLAAQTHIAIDSVLQKLLEDAGLIDELVRIPSGNLDKIHPSVIPLLVENKVKAFRERAVEKSHRYVRKLAQERNVDHQTLRLAVYIELYMTELDDELRIGGELREIENKTEAMLSVDDNLEDATQQTLLTKTVHLVTEEDNLREELAAVRDRMTRLKFEMIEAEPEMADAFATTNPKQELAEWSAAFGPDLAKDPVLGSIIKLQIEWLREITAGRALRKSVVQDAAIVAGTCVGIGSEIAEQEFDLCIVDETSKATAMEILIPMSRAKKWILVGDTKQLPPHIDREIKIREHELHWVENSLLKLLPDLAKGQSNTTADPSWYLTLKNQRRMTRGISDLISQVFYGGDLEPLRDDKSRQKEIAKAFPKPVIWIDVIGRSEEDAKRKKSLFNLKEIEVVIEQLNILQKEAESSNAEMRITVAVIAGYAAQSERLLERISSGQHQWPNLKIEVGSIDGFQGNEKQVAIVSLVRDSRSPTLGYLDRSERINVALSRAKDSLIIVGSATWVARTGDEFKIGEVLTYIKRKTNNACHLTPPR
jgi:serine/threonine protein kinase